MKLCESPISADLLLSSEPTIHVPALTEMLNDIMGPAGLEFERAETHEIILTAKRLFVHLSATEERLPDEAFATALSSTYGEILGEDWPGAIRGHKAALTVTVCNTAPHGDGGAIDEDLQELMLSVVHVTLTYLANALPPLAVHWRQTGQLFSPPRLMAMADMLFPLPLFLHPVPETSGRSDGETLAVGFRLLGAEQMIGTTLHMCEAPARLDWLVERVLAFVDHARAVGGPIPPGDTFGCAEGEKFAVTEDADGGLALTLVERDSVLVLQPEPKRPPSEAA